MDINNEIQRAIKHIQAQNPQISKSDDEVQSIVPLVWECIDKSQYRFEDSDKIILNKNGKKRLVKRFADPFSNENIICQVIKQILDKEFGIQYPNRNKTTKNLFEILTAVKQMAEFTIVKIDFKDYFNSLSSEYVYLKYLKPYISDRTIRKTIEDFCLTTKYTYAGFPTSNAMAEIVACEFDRDLKRRFFYNGIVFYERYIDDGLIIFNRFIDQQKVDEEIQKTIDSVFYDNCIDAKVLCKTVLNQQKYIYITKRNLTSTAVAFDFLGYEFWLINGSKHTTIQYGITKEKREKYQDRLNHIIRLYTESNSPDYNNLDLLRHRVAAFSAREVYLNNRYRSKIWRVKGFISNYGELRFLLNTGMIHPDTEAYLKNMVIDSFNQFGIMPSFLKGVPDGAPGYNLFHNMRVNRTILLVDGIGYSYQALVKKCQQIGISIVNADGNNRPYNSLVHEYLIKVKVGY
ncbi:MAG: hypothetical protein J6Z04_05530 [Clostridia bacterium]|nr:hypothetical protein [Clostridia bacterium]